ncbi:MAG: CusA/CzcA family heavy metal efflux RND transporter [Bacteroidota bacterium]
MLSKIIRSSVRNKFIVLLFTAFVIGFGIYAVSRISIGAVPDVTNNQVQVLTTSRNLSTLDVEQFITYPIELEMANLPGIKEIRSTSKFGLSVVTLVFEDDMGTYLPRQLIAEKIKSAEAKIPEGFGSPEMGPISTGLGEIYQYTIEVDEEHKDDYSLTDLRTIQDWIVRRQLAGIKGVVEINTWGGYLKQYEVAINTAELHSKAITINDLFNALEQNNSAAGGSYIEKEDQAYFIRGEGLIKDLDDIRETVITVKENQPITVGDVADVQMGHAPRFGAVTGNGEGEKVMGQIMMLKGANSNEVIETVKMRVAELQKSLPEGVSVVPFLDRSSLVSKTISTVIENLLIGFIIVTIVVILLIGNIRAGLIISSVIPLCFLIALSLMYAFNIDVNLMSMGALDFGIIIDGAVIIVEFTALQLLHKASKNGSISQEEKDETTISATSRMMKSAIFGQLIIIIVFIPILSLGGVEGKMFIPMALTFIFAIIGAIITCLTYVPVMSSLFLSKHSQKQFKISEKILDAIRWAYLPTLNWALSQKKLVIGGAIGLLALGVVVFSNMGAEFVPQLDEGDFVIQPVMKTGKSLEKVIEISTQIEQILLDKFPEVEKAVTRIGAAEVPTDPMSMEQTDVMVMLKDKSEWVSAESKDALADSIKKALEILPAIGIEFSQPIEMRFNELITGVRSDIAIKIFGEDLDILQSKGRTIKSLIKDIPGATDIVVEKVTGLPQMRVRYHRDKMAIHGLDISTLNEIVSMAFAGKTMGVIFEGEKRFDLVARLKGDHRESIEDLQNLMVDTPLGTKIPLNELASIEYAEGPAQISREQTNRRMVVGVNVRNSDLQTVVDQIKARLDEKLNLPTGYRITYGGQFENLQRASNRLFYAVPVALALIFIMLYFAFKSVIESILIFSAIPIAAVGGVLLLWVRDMPFSISAGVGFIALFGIAVLNGIILIEHYKTFDFSNTSVRELIVKGAKDRLLPVLLTASTTALGFLPMAISTGAGGEVQRPVATVVIGGLITSTLLTLIILPVLYGMLKSRSSKTIKTSNTMKVIPFLLLLSSGFAYTQEPPALNLSQLKNIANANNSGLKSSQTTIEARKKAEKTAFDFEKTEFYNAFDENDLATNGRPNHKFGVQQNFAFPSTYGSAKKLNVSRTELSEHQYAMRKAELFQQITQQYYYLIYLEERKSVLYQLDSVYSDFAAKAERNFELGGSNNLEKLTAISKQRKIHTDYNSVNSELLKAYEKMRSFIQSDTLFEVAAAPLEKLTQQNVDSLYGVGKAILSTQVNIRQNDYQLEKKRMLPDLSLNYSVGTNRGLDDYLHAYQVGIRIPLLYAGDRARIQSKKLEVEAQEYEKEHYEYRLASYKKQLEAQREHFTNQLKYYEEEGLALSQEITRTASKSYYAGEIDFFKYTQSLETAKMIQLEYLELLNGYNQTIIQLNYLLL